MSDLAPYPISTHVWSGPYNHLHSCLIWPLYPISTHVWSDPRTPSPLLFDLTPIPYLHLCLIWSLYPIYTHVWSGLYTLSTLMSDLTPIPNLHSCQNLPLAPVYANLFILFKNYSFLENTNMAPFDQVHSTMSWIPWIQLFTPHCPQSHNTSFTFPLWGN